MSTEPLLVTKRDDGVAVISTNDDPLNRMSVAYIDLLEAVIDDIAADDSVQAFVLTAEGTTNFSVGMNLKELGGAMGERGIDAFFDQRSNVISRIETMGTPSASRRSSRSGGRCSISRDGRCRLRRPRPVQFR